MYVQSAVKDVHLSYTSCPASISKNLAVCQVNALLGVEARPNLEKLPEKHLQLHISTLYTDLCHCRPKDMQLAKRLIGDSARY